MRNSWPKGIFSYFGYRQMSLQERLKLISLAGFTHTCVWWGEPERLWLEGRIDTVPQLVRDCGLIIENMHVPFEQSNQLWSGSRLDRQEFLDRHLAWLDDCRRHQMPCMVLHIAHHADGPGPSAQGLEVFRRLVAAAEEAGVQLAVENTRRDDIIDYLFENIDSSAMGFCYDSSHDWLWSSSFARSLQLYGHRLVQTHLSDTSSDADRHLIPGDGKVDWQKLTEAFPSQSYRGCIMLEVLPPSAESQDPQDFLRRCYERVDWIAEILAR